MTKTNRNLQVHSFVIAASGVRERLQSAELRRVGRTASGDQLQWHGHQELAQSFLPRVSGG